MGKFQSIQNKLATGVGMLFGISLMLGGLNNSMLFIIGLLILVLSTTHINKNVNKAILRKYVSVAMVMLMLVTVTVGCGSSSKEEAKKDEITSTNKDKEEDNTKVEENTNQEDKNDEKDKVNDKEKEDLFKGYKLIEVDGGNLSGHREPNVVVDIGFGDREYYAFTNEHGQLVKVTAKKIILQDDSKEPVTSSGRYYKDEAKVPGTEDKDLDEGHVIADSLGGVSNAYNITPQNSVLNRNGQQAYMEKVIRDAGGCTDFVAIITYPDTKTQIPSRYSYTYTLKGNVIKDEFDNINPDKANASEGGNTGGAKPNDSNNQPSKPSNSPVVYWTPKGKSYHTTKSCSTLSRSKTILEGALKDSGKADPCDKCH